MSQARMSAGRNCGHCSLRARKELLQALNEETLKLEKHPGDLEIVRSIRRIVHTLKGDAAAAGFQELSEVAHKLEDALADETSGPPLWRRLLSGRRICSAKC